MIDPSDLEKLEPVFAISSAILSTNFLIKEGIEQSFQGLLLPSLITSFGPALLCNSIFHKFTLTSSKLTYYSIGFLFSIFMSPNSILISVIRHLSKLSVIYSVYNFVNSPTTANYYFSLNIMTCISGLFLKRIVLKKGFKITPDDIYEIITRNILLYFIKMYRMPLYAIVVFVYLPMVIKGSSVLLARCKFTLPGAASLKKYKKSEPEDEDDEEQKAPTLLNTGTRVPRRKASLANKNK